MKKLNVLHITSWYPNRIDSNEGVYIREHINALNYFCENKTLHLRVMKSKEYGLSYNWKTEKRTISEKESSVIFFVKTTKSLIIELISFTMLFYQLVIKRKAKKADIINIHIAYPLGVYLNVIQLFVGKPFVFTEHWSAYHFNFHLDKKIKGLIRTKKIFSRRIPVITVSEALAKDIIEFSGEKIQHHVVPNVIDTDTFNYKGNNIKSPVFLMVNSWTPVKQPFVAIHAFEKLLTDYPNAVLKIAGYSRDNSIEKIKSYIATKKLEQSILLIGKLSKKEVAKELNACTALLQPTLYETFSVICAEAVSCGTPVIASSVGGIPDFINESNGILIDDLNIEKWMDAMKKVIENRTFFNKQKISVEAKDKFSYEAVGKKYYAVLQKIALKGNE